MCNDIQWYGLCFHSTYIIQTLDGNLWSYCHPSTKMLWWLLILKCDLCASFVFFKKKNSLFSLLSKNFRHCNCPIQVCCQKPSMTSSVNLLPHYDHADCYTFVIYIFWHFVQSFTDRTKVACCLGASDFVGGRSEIGNKVDAIGKGKALPVHALDKPAGLQEVEAPRICSHSVH